MNDSRFGLTASLWTADPERAARVGDRVETGTCLHEPRRTTSTRPSAGTGLPADTGRGAGLSVLGYHALTRPKSYHRSRRFAHEPARRVPAPTWSYPTAIALRPPGLHFAELPQACRACGDRKSRCSYTPPPPPPDRGLASMEITGPRRSRSWRRRGLGRALFDRRRREPQRDQPRPAGARGLKNLRGRARRASSPSAAARRLDLAKMVRLHVGPDAPDLGLRGTSATGGPAPTPPASPPSSPCLTTAGTGSEVGRASVITNSQTHVKKIIFHAEGALPRSVIADPELTVGMPKAITAGTGLDAFAHCVEAFSRPLLPPYEPGQSRSEGMRLRDREPAARLRHARRHRAARANMMSAAAMGAVALPEGARRHPRHEPPRGRAVRHPSRHHERGLHAGGPRPSTRPRSASASTARRPYLGIEGGYEGFRAFVQVFNDRIRQSPAGSATLGVTADRIDDMVAMALEDPSCGRQPRAAHGGEPARAVRRGALIVAFAGPRCGLIGKVRSSIGVRSDGCRRGA